MSSPNMNTRNELISMCKEFVKGASLSSVSSSTKVCLNTVRARRLMLIKLDIRMSVSMLPGRGYGTPIYLLEEPLEDAIKKIDKKYLPMEKTTTEAKVYSRIDPTGCGRNKGYGIENWFFMTTDCANAYTEWCKPWTVK